ncbi:hypothetical protein BC833DRAFT_645384, partial [Globomyces pollinis-pini]
MSKLYKVLTQQEFKQISETKETAWTGTELDKKDGFIHLSTKSQAVGVMNRFFSQYDVAYVYCLNLADIDHLIKWEPPILPGTKQLEKMDHSDLFPHAYGTLDMSDLSNIIIHNKVGSSFPDLP